MTRGWRAVASSIAVVVAGAQVVVTQPGYVQGLVDHAGRSDAQAGYLLSAEMTAFALATIAMTVIVNLVGRKILVGAGLVALIAGNALSATLLHSDTFFAARILVGISAGVLVPLGFSAIALTTNPDRDRYFGVMIACVLVYGAAVLGMLPTLFARGGLVPLFWVFGAFGVIALIGLRWFPQPMERAPTSPQAAGTRDVAWRTWIALGGMVAYFSAIGAVWSYASVIARAAGVSESSVAAALSVSQFTGIAGALVSVVLVTRLGRGWPITAGIIAIIIPMAIFMEPFGSSLFLAMIALYNFGWNLTHPYLLGTFADLDPTGRIVVYATAMQKIGLAVGPALAASLISSGNYQRPLLLAIGLAAASLVLVLPAAIQARRR